jgi:hypothetical protein
MLSCCLESLGVSVVSRSLTVSAVLESLSRAHVRFLSLTLYGGHGLDTASYADSGNRDRMINRYGRANTYLQMATGGPITAVCGA